MSADGRSLCLRFCGLSEPTLHVIQDGTIRVRGHVGEAVPTSVVALFVIRLHRPRLEKLLNGEIDLSDSPDVLAPKLAGFMREGRKHAHDVLPEDLLNVRR